MSKPKQFCVKKSQEDVYKEMEELTKIEMEKLHKKIKENPKILKPKPIYESDSDDDILDSSFSSTVTSSSDSDHINKNDSMKNNNSITLFKKEQIIDKLEEKNYYKSLELSNLMLENNELKDELENLKEKINDYEYQSELMTEIIELCKSEPLNKIFDESNYSILEKDYNDYKNEINELIQDLNSLILLIVLTSFSNLLFLK